MYDRGILPLYGHIFLLSKKEKFTLKGKYSTKGQSTYDMFCHSHTVSFSILETTIPNVFSITYTFRSTVCAEMDGHTKLLYNKYSVVSKYMARYKCLSKRYCTLQCPSQIKEISWPSDKILTNQAEWLCIKEATKQNINPFYTGLSFMLTLLFWVLWLWITNKKIKCKIKGSWNPNLLNKRIFFNRGKMLCQYRNY